MKKIQTFTQEERLKSRKAIEAIFENPKSSYSFPLKMFFQSNNESHLRIAVSVPKKRFKRAVDRNLLKRRITESYRKNKHIFYELNSELRFNIVFTYVHSEILAYSEIEIGMKKLLTYLASRN